MMAERRWNCERMASQNYPTNEPEAYILARMHICSIGQLQLYLAYQVASQTPENLRRTERSSAGEVLVVDVAYVGS